MPSRTPPCALQQQPPQQATTTTSTLLPAPAPGDSRRRRRQRASSWADEHEQRRLDAVEDDRVMVSVAGKKQTQQPQQGQATMHKAKQQQPQQPPQPESLPAAVVVVDPISSGAVLALLAQQRGYQVLAVYSDGLEEELLTLVPAQCRKGGFRFARTIKHQEGQLGETVATLLQLGREEFCIKQVLVGCESGVALYDALTHAVAKTLLPAASAAPSPAGDAKQHATSGPGTGELSSFAPLCEGERALNDFSLSAARRDKFLMSERVRAAGLRAARQLRTASWDEALPFLRALQADHPTGQLKAVLKPLASAGSDGVYFAASEAEARTAFDTILGGRNVFGADNGAVLIQEFLQGTEYVVDSVSHRGQHRVCCLWEYDKRKTNEAAFVYYGLRLFETPDRQRERRLAEYAHKCLDALGIVSGFSHAEVMWLEGADEPCLVEVGARPHGGEGTFVSLTREPIGYNQLSVSLDLLEDPEALSRLPLIPAPLKAHAAEVCLVSRKAGRLLRHRLDEVQATLPSVRAVELHVAVGECIRKTVDMLSSPGSAILCHRDRAVLEADYEAIHQMDLFYVHEEEEEEEQQERREHEEGQGARSGSIGSIGSSSSSSSSNGSTTTSGASDEEEEGGDVEED